MRVPPGSQLVFDQVMTGVAQSQDPPSNWLASATSDPKFNDWLGKANDLRLFVVVERVTIQVDMLIVGVQDTADEETSWATSTSTNHFLIPSGVTTILTSEDTDANRDRPGLGIRRVFVTVLNADAPFSARVRIWAAGRNGYRRFHRLLLSERMQGAEVPFYSLHEACAWVAGVDQIVIAAFAEEVSGATPELEVQVDESPNGRAWSFLSETAHSLTPGGPYTLNVASITDPPSGFLRFTARLDGSNPAATVRLWVTGRDVRAG